MAARKSLRQLEEESPDCLRTLPAQAMLQAFQSADSAFMSIMQQMANENKQERVEQLATVIETMEDRLVELLKFLGDKCHNLEDTERELAQARRELVGAGGSVGSSFLQLDEFAKRVNQFNEGSKEPSVGALVETLSEASGLQYKKGKEDHTDSRKLAVVVNALLLLCVECATRHVALHRRSWAAMAATVPTGAVLTTSLDSAATSAPTTSTAAQAVAEAEEAKEPAASKATVAAAAPASAGAGGPLPLMEQPWEFATGASADSASAARVEHGLYLHPNPDPKLKANVEHQPIFNSAWRKLVEATFSDIFVFNRMASAVVGHYFTKFISEHMPELKDSLLRVPEEGDTSKEAKKLRRIRKCLISAATEACFLAAWVEVSNTTIVLTVPAVLAPGSLVPMDPDEALEEKRKRDAAAAAAAAGASGRDRDRDHGFFGRRGFGMGGMGGGFGFGDHDDDGMGMGMGMRRPVADAWGGLMGGGRGRHMGHDSNEESPEQQARNKALDELGFKRIDGVWHAPCKAVHPLPIPRYNKNTMVLVSCDFEFEAPAKKEKHVVYPVGFIVRRKVEVEEAWVEYKAAILAQKEEKEEAANGGKKGKKDKDAAGAGENEDEGGNEDGKAAAAASNRSQAGTDAAGAAGAGAAGASSSESAGMGVEDEDRRAEDLRVREEATRKEIEDKMAAMAVAAAAADADDGAEGLDSMIASAAGAGDDAISLVDEAPGMSQSDLTTFLASSNSLFGGKFAMFRPELAVHEKMVSAGGKHKAQVLPGMEKAPPPAPAANNRGMGMGMGGMFHMGMGMGMGYGRPAPAVAIHAARPVASASLPSTAPAKATPAVADAPSNAPEEPAVASAPEAAAATAAPVAVPEASAPAPAEAAAPAASTAEASEGSS